MFRPPSKEKIKQIKNDPLYKEKGWITFMVFQLECFQGYPEGDNRQKNSSDSKLYRMKGNELYKSQCHNQEIHKKILELYSQSIALAPNKSEELAMAYGNRSALLQHLKMFDECLKDCDRAINMSKSEVLKAKLTCRKLECLAAKGDESFDSVWETALKSLMGMKLSDETKGSFVKKLNDVKKSESSSSLYSAQNSKKGKKSKKLKKEMNPSELFEHQKEIPCASEAVTIEYNEKCGRHIIATRNIDPGEIVAVEKYFHAFVHPEHLYLSCNYCATSSWSSIPCEGCIYGVYCSKECRAAAWEEYHKFECKIFPHVWDIAGDLVSATQTMRFFFCLVHKAGGILQLKEELMRVLKTKDPRLKGFSDDGVFHSDGCRSMIGLQNYSDEYDDEMQRSQAFNAVVALYYLAKETNFFGKIMGDSLIKLLPQNDLMLTAGAILLRTSYIPLRYQLTLMNHLKDDDDFVGMYMSPFCGLFNHSCNPNVKFIDSKSNETVVYAKHPIKKGEQLFRSYVPGYLNSPKEKRASAVMHVAHITCKCLACENDWTQENLPEAWDLVDKKRRSREVVKFFEKLRPVCYAGLKDMFIFKGSETLCKPEHVKEVFAMQKELAEKATAHNQEYVRFDEYVQIYFEKTFGRWYDIPEVC